MKTINKIITLFIVSCIAVSCNIDVLNPSQISTESFWKTEKDAWYAMNTIYQYVPAMDIWDEMTTDNSHSHKPWEGNFEAAQQSTLTAGTSYGSYSYTGIRHCNNYLENVDNCEMDEELKNRTKAEARFVRAAEYLDLTQYYGDVAIVTTSLPYDSPSVARNPRDEVRKFILDELEAVAEILPTTYGGGYFQETSRITKGAALALRARAALYFGNFTEAEKSAKAVMDLGKYELHTISALNDLQQKEADEMEKYIDFEAKGIDKDAFTKGMFSYESIWQSPHASANNKEYILTREYVNDITSGDWARYTYMIPYSMSIHWGFASFEPTQQLIDAYWDIDGQTIRPTISEETRRANFGEIWDAAKDLNTEEFAEFATGDAFNYEYMNEFKNRDSRLYASMMTPFRGWHNSAKQEPFYYKWSPSLVGSNGNETWTGYAYRKQVSITPEFVSWLYVSVDPYPAIRYSEVLLIFAEARTQNSGYDAQVTESLNLIRKRCGMPDVPTGLSKDQAIDFIRNERRIELAAEGHRFDDIRRYGADYCREVMTGPISAPAKLAADGSYIPYTAVTMSWDDKTMLMPIPQSVLDLNPLITQNPGY